MPELEIKIGGRGFRIACQEGEEPHLEAAAELLDREAQHLIASVGSVPESRMLLMAGLMLADRLTSGNAQVSEAVAAKEEIEKKLAVAERKVLSAEARASEAVQARDASAAQGKLFEGADGEDGELAKAALASLGRCAATVEQLAEVLESRAKG